MDWKQLAERFEPMTCVLSVEKKSGGGYGTIRIVTGNVKYLDSLALAAGGVEMDTADLLADIAKNRFVRAVTFSGGEPFVQAAPLLEIAQTLKQQGYHLLSFTGYTFEELLAQNNPAVRGLLETLDLLVDGKFLQDQRNLDLRFRGSENQRILDVPASLAANAPVWCESYR